jgi:putative endonuclease
MSENYTYMLRCSDGSFYIGWTNNLKLRVATHNAGRGGKYTRSRCPVELVYYETFPTKQEAMSREWHLKQLTHAQKLALLEGNGTDAGNAAAEKDADSEIIRLGRNKKQHGTD